MALTLRRGLIRSLWLFAFVALVFEPLYYFGCDWKYSNCELPPPSGEGGGGSSDTLWRLWQALVYFTAQVWRIYGSWDPLFLSVPPYLRVMCVIEVVVFGPCYALCAYALERTEKPAPSDAKRAREHRYWQSALVYLGLPFCGALVYSTLVYFAMEGIEAAEARASAAAASMQVGGRVDLTGGFNLWMVFLVNIPWTIVPLLVVWEVLKSTTRAAECGLSVGKSQ